MPSLRFVGMLLLFSISPKIFAWDIERWVCKDFPGVGEDITLEVDGKHLTGTVNVAGETQQATYGIEGINRLWRFGPEFGKGSRYAIAIRPNGEGTYFDFALADTDKDGRARSTWQLVCTRLPDKPGFE